MVNTANPILGYKKVQMLAPTTVPQADDIFYLVRTPDTAPTDFKIKFSDLATAIIGSGLVQSVTGLDTDNTDPANPIVQIAVDGVTITGDGTPGNPLVSVGVGDVTAASNLTANHIVLGDDGVKGVKTISNALLDDLGNASFATISVTDANLIPSEGLYLSAAGNLSFAAGGFKQVGVTSPGGTPVNFVNLQGSTAGNPVFIVPGGASATAGLVLAAKGAAGIVSLRSNSGANVGAQVITDVSSVNYFQFRGTATGVGIELSAVGTDADIDIEFFPKGAGVIKFGTHSALAGETVTGYITIRDTSGVLRKLAVVS